MAKHSPYAVVVAYDEEQQRLSVKAADPNKLAPQLHGVLEMPILLEEFDYRIDDEFARRLGAAMLNLIAAGQPEIEKYMSVTLEPIPRDGERNR
ncbi:MULTISPECIES: hypothetical protein [Burkholderia]|uniref:hypothetical protein n=1 Tax=Burkholderia cepacia complex TaxID=87882 RepID=UPI00075CFBAD|nr:MULTISPECIES: hypothetical protein [Burkholderia cepacia complex]KWA10651.1 hypothetical protein WT36_00175 [Burkholderia territorii]RQU10176.1 hypothetical protein DF152_26295 [Burkholderia cenocepacia]